MDKYKVLGSVWYTPPFPGLDPLQHVISNKPSISIVVVAIASGPDRDGWKAYIGWVPFDSQAEDGQNEAEQLVASNGAKMSKEVAFAHFPSLDPERYKM